MSEEFSLRELAARTGVSARTIRYYIARGLLPPPLAAGRHARYGREHEQRLRQIQEGRRRGCSLAEMGGRLPLREGAGPEPEPVLRLRLTEDVTVFVEGGLSPWRMHHVRRILAEAQAKLNALGAKEQ